MSPQQKKFRQAALASKLVTKEQLQAAIALVMQSPELKDRHPNEITDKQLALKLVEMKVISAYQADQLRSGRTKLTLGPYVITDWIGQGGMGQVFKAEHNMLGRECAIKVLPLHKSNPDSIENFRREVRAQAKLDHPNLVRAYDAGEDGNVQYMVVEFVHGTDLRRLVRNKGKLSVQQSASIIMQAAEGLAHAHQRGLIHRDIKPGNILVTPDGKAKLSDLGLAFYLHDTNDPRVGKIVGTADYLSPEQIKTPLQITSASDIYSLGCTLYYACTGKVPFPGGTPKTKAMRHLEETPWHPRRFNEEVSDDFVDLIGDMMEKDPRERIQHAQEVIERLAPWAADSSGIYPDDLDSRPRWNSSLAHQSDSQEQDTDPSFDQMMLEGEGSHSNLHASGTGKEHSTDGSSIIKGMKKAPPPPLSTVQQYTDAKRLNDAVSFGVTELLVVGAVCLFVGIIVGMVIAFMQGS